MKQVSRTWLTKIREDMKLTQDELASKAKISRSYLSGIESGKRNPSVEVAKKIADVLGFDWTEFFK